MLLSELLHSVEVIRVTGNAEQKVINGITNDSTEFVAEVDKVSKIMNILRADYGVGEKGSFVVVIGPPIPGGKYLATATGYQSDRQASCDFIVKNPTILDRVKDFIGGLLGKIKKS